MRAPQGGEKKFGRGNLQGKVVSAPQAEQECLIVWENLGDLDGGSG